MQFPPPYTTSWQLVCLPCDSGFPVLFPLGEEEIFVSLACYALVSPYVIIPTLVIYPVILKRKGTRSTAQRKLPLKSQCFPTPTLLYSTKQGPVWRGACDWAKWGEGEPSRAYSIQVIKPYDILICIASLLCCRTTFRHSKICPYKRGSRLNCAYRPQHELVGLSTREEARGMHMEGLCFLGTSLLKGKTSHCPPQLLRRGKADHTVKEFTQN